MSVTDEVLGLAVTEAELVHPYALVSDLLERLIEVVPSDKSNAREPVLFVREVAVGNMSRRDLISYLLREVHRILIEKMVRVEAATEVLMCRKKLDYIGRISAKTCTGQALNADDRSLRLCKFSEAE